MANGSVLGVLAAQKDVSWLELLVMNVSVFAGAALVTYAFRLGGLLLSEKLPDTGRFKDFMAALPGTILVALVAPGILAAGLLGCLTSLATALLVWRTGNVFVAMLSGMVIVAGARLEQF